MSDSSDGESYVKQSRREAAKLSALGDDDNRPSAVAARRERGYRTARENLDDLCDAGSFVEYGKLAVAAQHSRRDLDDLRANTPADGVITGTATINAAVFGAAQSRAAIAINDYSVLAGTQGYFHHKKIDRLLAVAEAQRLPVVMYTEGGGGRPGDDDITTQIAGLNVPTFARWAGLARTVPRIAVNNGYCFAGNAALFGCADIRIATKSSWIGMAGPAMIEGGGLGKVDATEIGPSELHVKQGVIDVCASDEAHATGAAKKLLGYFQGELTDFDCAAQDALRSSLPDDRQYSYKIRELIEVLVDAGSFFELTRDFGGAVITGFARLKGRPLGLVANDSRVLGGAVDADAARKAARFLRLCDAFNLPVLSLVDTPGFMVGPDSEAQAAVLHMSDLFIAGARLSVPLVAVCLRKAYGLGAMAMTGGSFVEPVLTVAWPSGEIGAMGLEGAVRLGYRKELHAESDPEKRQQLFEARVANLYEKGKAIEAARVLEVDAVIDPADTRDVVCNAFGFQAAL